MRLSQRGVRDGGAVCPGRRQTQAASPHSCNGTGPTPRLSREARAGRRFPKTDTNQLNPAAASRDTPMGICEAGVGPLRIFGMENCHGCCCVATLATVARASNPIRTTTRNALVLAVAIGLLEETEHGSYRLGSKAAGVRSGQPGGHQFPH